MPSEAVTMEQVAEMLRAFGASKRDHLSVSELWAALSESDGGQNLRA